MPHAIDDADWPLFRRLMGDYKAGRLNNKPPKPDEPRRGGGKALLLGRTTEKIEQGSVGKIVKLRGKQGEEQEAGNPFDAYCRFGDLPEGVTVLYARVGRGWEIVQSIGCDVPIPDDWFPPPEEGA